MPEEEEAFRYRAASLGLTVHITRRCDQTAIVPFLKHPGERCPMLDEATSACRIYDDRPQRCRAFPEGPRPGCALADAPTLQGLLSTLCSRPGR